MRSDTGSVKLVYVLQWLLVPVISYTSATIAIVLCEMMQLLLQPHDTPYPYEVDLCGGVSAFTFVVSGACFAPNHKRVAALLLFTLGAYISWPLLSVLRVPRSITPDHLPLFITYFSGLAGVVFVHFLMKHRYATRSTQ